MKIRRILRLIQDDGWELERTRGSHMLFRHPWKRGSVTVPNHSELCIKTVRSVLRQAQIDVASALNNGSDDE